MILEPQPFGERCDGGREHALSGTWTTYLGTQVPAQLRRVLPDSSRTSLLFRSLSARVRILPMGSSLEWGVRFDREPSNSQHL